VPSVTDFDEWYTNMATSPVRDEIVQRALGLPPELQSSSLLSWDGLGEVVAALALGPGHTLLDLACGRGGYGLEVARRTGARVVGVDFSAVAVGQARDRAAAVGLADRVEFRVGERRFELAFEEARLHVKEREAVRPQLVVTGALEAFQAWLFKGVAPSQLQRDGQLTADGDPAIWRAVQGAFRPNDWKGAAGGAQK